jgi:hypothetical protein
MTIVARTLTTTLLLSGLSLLQAQTDEPRLLRIVREDVKSGKGSEHSRIEAAYARAFAKAGFANYIGMENVTGSNQAWFVEAFDSWAAIEGALAMQGKEPLRSEISPLSPKDGDVLHTDSSVVASLQRSLSYLPGTFHPSTMRFLNVYTIRIHPGRDAEFAERAKLLNAAREKAGWKGRAAVYRVLSGAPEGTYLVLTPLASLEELDAEPQAMKIDPAIVMESGYTLFSVNPKMSNPPKAVLDADPGFWKP